MRVKCTVAYLLEAFQEIGLLDLCPSLSSHCLPDFLSFGHRSQSPFNGAFFIPWQIDSLSLHRDLWCKGIYATRCKQLRFQFALTLGSHTTLLFRLGELVALKSRGVVALLLLEASPEPLRILLFGERNRIFSSFQEV